MEASFYISVLINLLLCVVIFMQARTTRETELSCECDILSSQLEYLTKSNDIVSAEIAALQKEKHDLQIQVKNLTRINEDYRQKVKELNQLNKNIRVARS